MTTQLDAESYLDRKGIRYKRHENAKGLQLVVDRCPICQGGESGDRDTFAVHAETGAANCKRGNCGWQGSFTELQRELGDEPQGRDWRNSKPRHFVKPAQAKPKVYAKPKDETEARAQALKASGTHWRYLTGLTKATVADVRGKQIEAQGRGFTPEIIERFRLGLAAKSFSGQKDTWHDRQAIAIPYFRGGELVRTKYRTVAKDFAIDKGSEPCLYNRDAVAGREVVICEGEFDVIALAQCGVVNAVSVPDGCKDHAWIDHEWDWLSEMDTVVIAVDTDEGGISLEREIVRRLGRERCVRVNWPHKDANGCLQAGMSPEAIAALVKSAAPYPLETLRSAIDLWDDVWDLYTGNRPQGYSTGWKAVDRILGGVRMGEVTVVTGTPSSGKSEWTNALLINLARQGVKSVVASLENPTPKVIRNQASQVTGKSFHGPGRMSEAELSEAVAWLSDRVSYVDLPDDGQSWQAVEEHIRYAARRYGAEVAIVDPLTMLLANSSPDRERLDVDNIMRASRRLVTSLGIHLIIVAHPRKLANDNAVAQLYDINGSAGVRNLTWNGVSVWRDKEGEKAGRNAVQVHVLKNREYGMEGMAELLFRPNCKRYEEPLTWPLADDEPITPQSATPPQPPAEPGVFAAGWEPKGETRTGSVVAEFTDED
jgi:twinkle protein